jgi:RHS repeat-associated protein
MEVKRRTIVIIALLVCSFVLMAECGAMASTSLVGVSFESGTIDTSYYYEETTVGGFDGYSIDRYINDQSTKYTFDLNHNNATCKTKLRWEHDKYLYGLLSSYDLVKSCGHLVEKSSYEDNSCGNIYYSNGNITLLGGAYKLETSYNDKIYYIPGGTYTDYPNYYDYSHYYELFESGTYDIVSTHCSVPEPIVSTHTNDSVNSATYKFKILCKGYNLINTLTVTGSAHGINVGDFLINGIKSINDPSLKPGEFLWNIPIDAKCGEYVTLTPKSLVDNRIVSVTLNEVKIISCNLAISDFHGSNTVINPSAGGRINLIGSIDEDSGNQVSWTVSLMGRSYSGIGRSPAVTWDGKDADGKVVDPGTYIATLTAQTVDGQCSDTEMIPFTVMHPSENSCGLYVNFGSSANMASGALTQNHELFTARGGAIPLSLTISYNSLDGYAGPLGKGWTHSYDTFLKFNSDGSVVLHDGSGKRRLYTFANGAYISTSGDYSTLSKNGDGLFVLTGKDGTTSTFTADGRISSIADRNGNTLSFAYSGGNLASVTDSSRRVATFAYDAAKHLTSVTDPFGNLYTFSMSGNTLSTVIFPNSGAWHYTYDANAFMLTKSDPLGNTTTYAYDDQHRVLSSLDPEGRTRSVTYPATSDPTRTTIFTEKDGGAWSYSYDTRKGHLLAKTDPQGGVTSYGYDSNGNRTSTTLPDGTTTTSTYDASGNMLTSTDAMGQTTTYSYNGFGQVTAITDPQGGTVTYGYDAKGNLTTQADQFGATTTYAYDAKGNVTKATDPAGQSTSFGYDQSGNLTNVTDPSGATTLYTYDTAGNIATITDAKGAVTTFVYDSGGRLIKTIDPNGNEALTSYDLNGNKLSDTDANGNVTTYEYNNRNQLIKTIDPEGNGTSYAYGGSSCPSCGGGSGEKLTSLTDAGGNTTSYLYDQLGRLAAETDPLGNTTRYSYDARGNLTAKSDAGGNTINYSYDGNGKLLKKTYPDKSEESFTYDARGSMLTATNTNISYTFGYDTAGRMLSSTDSSGRVVQYGYDAAGRKSKTIYPEGSVVSYVYDTVGRLSTITNGGGRTYGYSYDTLGRRNSLSYPNGASATYGYDLKGNLTSLVHKTSSGKVIDSFDYTHDKVGNRLSKAEAEITWNYGYDKLYRLLQALPTKLHGKDKEQKHKGENYSYDPTGNRLTGPRKHAEYSYGPGNQLLTSRHTAYAYDKNGNLIGTTRQHPDDLDKKEHEDDHHDEEAKGATWAYTYDYENRLVRAETDHDHEKTVVTFKYDPLGRRIEKKTEKTEHGNSKESTTHTYVYDGQAIILEYVTRSDDGKKQTEVSKFVHGPGIDEHLSMEKRGGVFFYHADGLGSIVALTDGKQTVVENYEYDSFGNLKNDALPMQPFTYTGREWDKETGLYYYRARYYDPIEGRFLSRDPIGFEGGINLYAYTLNNPINYTDPFGEKVTISITRESSTQDSFSGRINVASDIVSDSFSGYTLEPVRNKIPVLPGTYKAKLRKDHNPWRIELIGVPGNSYIQIHKGNYPQDSAGCFLVGTGRSKDMVTNSGAAMTSILEIINKDCSDDITVIVGGISSTCASCHK